MIGGTTLKADLQRLGAKILHKEDPTVKIGVDQSRAGERFLVHFYDEGDPTLAKAKDVEFGQGEIVLYVNVNYAPEQLEQYTQDIYLGNIEAIYDFAFSFTFSARDE